MKRNEMKCTYDIAFSWATMTAGLKHKQRCTCNSSNSYSYSSSCKKLCPHFFQQEDWHDTPKWRTYCRNGSEIVDRAVHYDGPRKLCQQQANSNKLPLTDNMVSRVKATFNQYADCTGLLISP